MRAFRREGALDGVVYGRIEFFLLLGISMMLTFKRLFLSHLIAVFCLVVGCQSQPAANSDTSINQPVTVTTDQLASSGGAALSDGLMPTPAIASPGEVRAKKAKPHIQITQPDFQSSAPAPLTPSPAPPAPPVTPGAPGVGDAEALTSPTVVGSKALAAARPMPPAPRSSATPEAKKFARKMESAHGRFYWRDSRCLKANIVVRFNQNVILEGTLLTDRSAGKTRLDLIDGTTVVYDGRHVWVSPQDSPLKRARFHALTWAYFVVAPFKLRDPGSILTSLPPQTLGGRAYHAAQLTFAPGVGDTPDDWYIVYADADAKQPYWLRAMAYIVTYGTAKADAEKEPHAITFDDFIKVRGVVLARRWTFRHWSLEQGVYGEPIGNARLTGLQLIPPDRNAFVKPQDAVLSVVPN